VVKELPKGALVEKQVWLHTGRVQVASDADEDESEVDDDVTWENRRPVFDQGRQTMSGDRHGNLYWEVSRFEQGSTSSSVMVFIRDMVDSGSLGQALARSRINLRSVASIKYLYVSHSDSVTDALSAVFKNDLPPIQPIKCSALSSRTEDDWSAVLCITGV